jgi:hypothetical protein
MRTGKETAARGGEQVDGTEWRGRSLNTYSRTEMFSRSQRDSGGTRGDTCRFVLCGCVDLQCSRCSDLSIVVCVLDNVTFYCVYCRCEIVLQRPKILRRSQCVKGKTWKERDGSKYCYVVNRIFLLCPLWR